MVTLTKVWVAFFMERQNKHSFATQKVIAHSYDDAEDLAWEWGREKYGARLVDVKIEKSKGEVLCQP
jgi:hypothetical protein